MPVKVSVVVPVYNPGRHIEECIASLLRQSLPVDEYEVIFVDDGSDDGTGDRLDRLAAENPNVHVIHQEPSGWSGKPRNVGIDASRGEFVMFVDNDDWLGDEALERMYRYAVENDADVVVGKMAGRGRPVPRELFRKNRPRASVSDAPLIDSLTPHKMFRREFLERNGLRFPEGRRRLEDHVFVAEAYLLARNVSVLSDYVCYYHVKRDEEGNAGFQRFDPVGYFANLREALDVVERHTEPGPLRDRLLRRWLRNEMIERMRGDRLLNLPEDYRRELFHEIRKTAAERFGPGVFARLQPIQQVVAALIVADRLPAVEEIARWEAGIKPAGRLERLEWDGGALRLGFTAEYLSGGEPMLFRSGADGDVVAPPLSAATLEAMTGLGVAMGVAVDKAKVDLVLRERSSSAEFFQPVTSTRKRITAEGGAFRLVLDACATVDPQSAANGKPLAAGVWDVVLRISLAGWTKDVRLGAERGDGVDAAPAGALTGSPPRLVLPYWTRPGDNLSLDVDQSGDRAERDLARVSLADATFEGGRLEVPLPLRVTGGCDVPVRFTRRRKGGTVDLPARLEPAPAGSVLTVGMSPGLGPGSWLVWLGIPTADREAPLWTRIPIKVDASSGSLRRAPGHTPAALSRMPAVASVTDYARKVRRRLRRIRSARR